VTKTTVQCIKVLGEYFCVEDDEGELKSEIGAEQCDDCGSGAVDAEGNFFQYDFELAPQDATPFPYYECSNPECKAQYTVFRLADRERELLEIKGPCWNATCRLHKAHFGPCDVREELRRRGAQGRRQGGVLMADNAIHCVSEEGEPVDVLGEERTRTLCGITVTADDLDGNGTVGCAWEHRKVSCSDCWRVIMGVN
jgi:hypothetical protein